MTSDVNNHIVDRFKRSSQTISVIVFCLGLIVLVGWIFDVPVLIMLLPKWPTMKVNSAIGFMLVGLALFLVHLEHRSRYAAPLSKVCAAPVALIGLLTLVEFFFNVDLRIDQWLIPESRANFPNTLGRMAPVSALNFFLLGMALVALQSNRSRLGQGLAMIVISTGLIGFLGFFYGVEFLSRVVAYSAIAFHTAVAFVLCGFGILCAKPECGLARAFCVGEGGIIVRRILPLITLISFIFGLLCLRGEQMGLYGMDFAIALFAFANIVSLSIIVGLVARSLNVAEAERNKATEALATSEEQLRMATEAAEVGTWSYFPSIGRAEWSREAKRLFGIPTDATMTYDLFLSRLHPDDRQRVHETVQQAIDPNLKMPFDIKHRVVRPDGSVRWVNAKGRLGFEHNDALGVRFSGTVRDITSEKNAEEAVAQASAKLKQYATELESMVAERTAKLEKTVASLETMIYTIAHDLRAPLRAMQGFTHALLEEYAPGFDHVGKEYCIRINTAAGRMDTLISDLLEYGKISRSDVPKKMVDLNREIDAVLEILRDDINKRGAEVVVEKPLPEVCGDSQLLDSVLKNLLSNALKFVQSGTVPKIHVYAEHREQAIRLCVEDNGIGIAPEHRDKIFGVFERLHADDRFQGTGVGLALVQKGIEQMGGRVGVESEPKKGSRFWIELPDKEHCAVCA